MIYVSTWAVASLHVMSDLLLKRFLITFLLIVNGGVSPLGLNAPNEEHPVLNTTGLIESIILFPFVLSFIPFLSFFFAFASFSPLFNQHQIILHWKVRTKVSADISFSRIDSEAGSCGEKEERGIRGKGQHVIGETVKRKGREGFFYHHHR